MSTTARTRTWFPSSGTSKNVWVLYSLSRTSQKPRCKLKHEIPKATAREVYKQPRGLKANFPATPRSYLDADCTYAVRRRAGNIIHMYRRQPSDILFPTILSQRARSRRTIPRRRASLVREDGLARALCMASRARRSRSHVREREGEREMKKIERGREGEREGEGGARARAREPARSSSGPNHSLYMRPLPRPSTLRTASRRLTPQYWHVRTGEMVRAGIIPVYIPSMISLCPELPLSHKGDGIR